MAAAIKGPRPSALSVGGRGRRERQDAFVRLPCVFGDRCPRFPVSSSPASRFPAVRTRHFEAVPVVQPPGRSETQ